MTEQGWDPKVYRDRAEAYWRQQAALLPQGGRKAATCLKIAEGYARLAELIEAERQEPA